MNDNSNLQESVKITRKSKNKKIIIGIILAILLFLSGFGTAIAVQYIEQSTNSDTPNYMTIDKPVIYLYPTKTENIQVKLKYNGKLTSTYPNYDKSINGWEVTANPDGSLIDNKDGLTYSYIFWEGLSNTDYSRFNDGFIVKGPDTKTFLQSTLSKMGLTAKEYNEMIVYWLPKMENNKYNLIHFAGKEYTDSAQLKVTPAPDSILRVFMVFKPLNNYQEIKPQQINTFERKGFTVIEWGGTEIK